MSKLRIKKVTCFEIREWRDGSKTGRGGDIKKRMTHSPENVRTRPIMFYAEDKNLKSEDMLRCWRQYLRLIPGLHTHVHTHTQTPHTHTYSCSHACTHSEWWEETDRQLKKVLPLPVGTLGHFCFRMCYPGCWRWHSQVCRRRPVSQEKEHIWVPAGSLWITKSTNWAIKSNVWVLQIPESQSWGKYTSSHQVFILEKLRRLVDNRPICSGEFWHTLARREITVYKDLVITRGEGSSHKQRARRKKC